MAIAQPNNRPEPCVLVIFGASGDLTSRKLVPALYELFRAGRLPEPFAVMGVARTKMSDDEWRAKLREWASQHMGGEGFDPASWAEFEKIVHYQPASATEADAYPVLIARINALASEHGMCRDTADELPTWAQQPNVLFYLSVAPHLYEPIISQIGESGMVFEGKRWCAIGEDKMPWQRIIVEKPFGEDLESARALNRSISRVFNEDMIYRIDHYLGKELVQNILVMRFANSIFEPLWSNAHIDHVQVTAAEKVGVGQRAGNFYDRAGATKDMIQSHLLQVLALVAMEAPNSYDPDAIRREKIKVLQAARIMTEDEAVERAVLGRYGPSGNADDEDGGLGYTQLEGVDTSLGTETFSAIRVDIENWRWAGVPFFVRSGKKMASKLTEVVIQLKDPPADLFRHLGVSRPANRIVINIAPDEGISLRFEAKVPGPDFVIGSVEADMSYPEFFDSKPVEAYGPLMLDAMRGDQTLFKHRDEVEGGWSIVEPMLRSEALRKSIQTYDAGSWGPSSADALLTRECCEWKNG